MWVVEAHYFVDVRPPVIGVNELSHRTHPGVRMRLDLLMPRSGSEKLEGRGKHPQCCTVAKVRIAHCRGRQVAPNLGPVQPFLQHGQPGVTAAFFWQ